MKNFKRILYSVGLTILSLFIIAVIYFLSSLIEYYYPESKIFILIYISGAITLLFGFYSILGGGK